MAKSVGFSEIAVSLRHGTFEMFAKDMTKISPTVSEKRRGFAATYLQADADSIHWAMIRAIANSVAQTAIVPLQDVLGLDGRARMNVPATTEGNWTWRFDWNLVDDSATRTLAAITATSGRGPIALLTGPGNT